MAASSETQMQLFTFVLDGEEYALNVMAVREIINMTDITKTVNCQRQVEGVINLRGSIVPIISLRKRLGLPELPDNYFSCIAVLDCGGELTGFVIDQVSDVIRVDARDVLPPLVGNTEPWIAGILNLDQKLVLVMNPEHLV